MTASTAPSARAETPGFPSLQSCLRTAGEAKFTDEYAVKLRRLFPWPAVVETNRPITGFGVIWVVIEPGKLVETHDHDEEECFIVVDGEAEFTMNAETVLLRKGDVVYVPRFAPHALRNLSASEDFVMIDVYWDDRSAEKAAGTAGAP